MDKLKDLARDLSESRKSFNEQLKEKNSDLESLKKSLASEKRDMQSKIEGYDLITLSIDLHHR
jgi:hypothetical protein